MGVALVNPLGAGLFHYTTSLEHVLRTCGVSTHRFDVMEPSSADYGKIRWISSYLWGVRKEAARHSPDSLFASWPAVGYWDIPILARIARRRPTYLVIHDPRPLVHARGYGHFAAALARRQANINLVVHSSQAAVAVREEAGLSNVFEVLHPMLKPRQATPPVGSQRIVRVLGQYKPDRDIKGLRLLAANAPATWRLEIIGRDWPLLNGWSVRNAFVSEESFDQLLRTSDVILIPYTRFYQSGVAVRALECGIPVVGPSASSLQVALGKSSPWLVKDGDWVRSVLAAVDRGWSEGYAMARDLYSRVISNWSDFLAETGLR